MQREAVKVYVQSMRSLGRTAGVRLDHSLAGTMQRVVGRRPIRQRLSASARRTLWMEDKAELRTRHVCCRCARCFGGMYEKTVALHGYSLIQQSKRDESAAYA